VQEPPLRKVSSISRITASTRSGSSTRSQIMPVSSSVQPRAAIA